MEIWGFGIQIVLDVTSGVFVRPVTSALSSPTPRQRPAQGAISARKMEIKRKQSSFRESSFLGVAEEEEQEDLQRDHVKQSLRDQFYVG